MTSTRRRSLQHGLRMVRNRTGRRRFARAALGVEDVPIGAVVVYFAAVPDELYQLEQWGGVLQRVARERPVVVVVGEPDIGRLVGERTGLPTVFAARGAELERLVERQRPAAVLYVNHRMQNFTMLRYPGTVHIYLGHGESDKDASISHQNLAYDYCFVAGRAAQERLAAALPLLDVDRRAPMVGRPNLDPELLGAGRPDDVAEAGDRSTVLYAPTWEGGLPSMAVGSVPSHGEAIVASVLADPALRLIYRPHPLTGTVSPATAAADRRIRAQIEAAGRPHFIDTGPYGWVFGIAAIAVVDVSSVAYDWLTTGRPLIVTTPVSERARPPATTLYDRAPALGAAEAADTAALIHRTLARPPAGWDALVEHHLGDIRPGASIRRFLAALDAVAPRPPTAP